jgi:hypothetical protein
MPGDELARQLPPIPVVCISGTKTRVDELEKDRGAVTRFLKKPFAFPAFLDLVAKLVQAPESQ